MKFSLQMHSLHSIADWVAMAQQAEACGLAEIRIAERIDFPYPTWPTLFVMAEHTQRISLGTGVTNPYSRHPALTAKMIALLDKYSQGRATLGIGQGDFWQFDQLGIKHERPLQTLREAVQLIRHFLANNEAAFEGKVFTVPEDYPFPWRPHRDHVPIFIGSRSPGGMAVAGEVADELHLPNCVAPQFIALAQQQLRLGMEKAGRKGHMIPLACSPQLGLSRDRDAAIHFAQERIGGFIQWMEVPRQLLGIEPEEAARLSQARRDGDNDYLYKNISRQYLEAFAVAGTPQDVITQLERLAGLGIDHITFNEPGPNQNEALALLEREVLPHFAN